MQCTTALWPHANAVSEACYGHHGCEHEATVQADAGCGANRWDTAAFSNETDKEKFSRLMVSLHMSKSNNTMGQMV